MASSESPDTQQDHFIEDFILLFESGRANSETRLLTSHREKLEPWLNRTANLDELKESFSSALEPSEKQFLQIIALLRLHYELIDNRDPLPAEANSSTLTPEENDRRSSIALRRELDQNRLKDMCNYWSALDRLERLVSSGQEYANCLPNYEVRIDYFKTCLTHFRTNLRVLLRYNLVERMPAARNINDTTIYAVTDIKYRIPGNWLLESLYTPVRKLLENLDQPPSAEVCWPGDEKPVIEPKSSFKHIFTAEIIMTNRLEGELFDSTELRNNITVEGQPLKNYHIISKDLLLQLSKKLQESLPINSSSCPQIDHRFDNVVHYNCRKFYIINHWLKSPPSGERGRCERPVFGAIFYENWYSTNFDDKVIAWLEGNLLRGPSPQLRGPFDPNTWQDSSFEEDAKCFLGQRRFAEFRRLRDSIREYIDLGEPTDEQTDQILEDWADVFWRYPLNSIPVTKHHWVRKRPTEDELRRLKGHWQDVFKNKERHWAMRSEF